VLVEGNHYFPESALNRDVVTFSNHKTSCAWKGELNLNAVWYYPNPKEGAEAVKGRVAFWNGVKIEI
jgi:uncharacterized protein (DUF427 family)